MKVSEVTETGTNGATRLACKLGDEVFAIDIGKVREALDFTTASKVTRMSDFLHSVIIAETSMDGVNEHPWGK